MDGVSFHALVYLSLAPRVHNPQQAAFSARFPSCSTWELWAAHLYLFWAASWSHGVTSLPCILGFYCPCCHMGCDWKICWIFKFQKLLHKRYIAINPPKTLCLPLNTLVPSFWPLYNSVSSFLCLVLLWLLNVLNWLKPPTFCDCIVLGEEPEVAQCQLCWIRRARTHHNVFANLSFWWMMWALAFTICFYHFL